MATSEALFTQAISAFQAGKLDAAERTLKLVLAQTPKHFGALNVLGVLLASKKQYAEAENYLKSALKIDSKSGSTFYNYGIVLKGMDRPAEALRSFDKAIALNPAVADAWNNRGTVLNDLDRHEEALKNFDKAIALLPNFAVAFCNKGKSLEHLGRDNEAFWAYEQAFALAPNLPEASLGRGNTLAKARRYDEALSAYRHALNLKPDTASAALGCSKMLERLERHGEARLACERVLRLNPDDVEGLIAYGNALLGLKQIDESLNAFDRALALAPGLDDALLGRGNVFYDTRRYDESLAAYDQILKHNVDCAEAWLGRGNALTGLKHHNEALVAFDKALELSPTLAEAWLGRGNAHTNSNSYNLALDAYEKALSLAPDLVKAWMGRGNAFCGLRNYDQSLKAYAEALARDPKHVGAWVGRGQVLFELKRYEEALTAFDKALQFDPNLAEAWMARGSVFSEVKQYSDALVAFGKALELRPDLASAEGRRLTTMMQLCEWRGFEDAREHLISSVRQGRMTAMSSDLFGVDCSAADQLMCARLWAADRVPVPQEPRRASTRSENSQIRVAYLSGDFRDHAVAHLLVGVLEQHNHDRFELIGLSTAADDSSEVRRRIKNSFDQFFDVGEQPDSQISQLVSDLEVDILVDLMGFTVDARPNVLARRPAPIQVSYLGYPGTGGTDYIDYILADRVVIPEHQRACYSEKVVYLPNTYLPADRARTISKTTPSRADCGLPESGFVFCSFNNNFKITPPVFDVWMKLLRQVDDSLLWLANMNDTVAENLRREARNRGVSPDRIMFAQRVTLNEDHLARLALADLALDTLPYNGHTTTSDALWVGLPVLTCRGETFAAQVAASVLEAIRMPELIAPSLAAYERIALDLATDPRKLSAVRQKLADHRLTTPLFDTKAFSADIEDAFASMYERHRAGLSPDHFAVGRHSARQAGHSD